MDLRPPGWSPFRTLISPARTLSPRKVMVVGFGRTCLWGPPSSNYFELPGEDGMAVVRGALTCTPGPLQPQRDGVNMG